MIGVICSDSEAAIAEEFFQLFKTPWQRFREGKRYDVVIATEDALPNILPRLLVAYGSPRRQIDAKLGISEDSPAEVSVWRYGDVELPIYGDGRTFGPAVDCVPVIRSQSTTTGYCARVEGMQILRLGYDLFHEISFLLSNGQPAQRANIPTLEIHIAVLRDGIVAAGIPLLEIPPAPAGKRFSICITHDIDFVGIRGHKFDHTMLGFLYRSTLGGLRDCLRGRISVGRMLRMWWAVLVLPFVYLGLARDYWLPFEWYLRVEKGLPVTYFLVPFKNRPGEKNVGHNAERRATKYDVTDIPEWIATLVAEGCEIGVHGIDAWHDVNFARAEMTRVAAAAQATVVGIRMHWLLRDSETFDVLDRAGYAYDSTAGYNEAVGYRCGTMQVFRPSLSHRLLELPLHIQDGALFYPGKLGLDEVEAWRICEQMIRNAEKLGGVLTVLWHDRSHGPERFWGDFYIRLLSELRRADAWFASASQAVEWFRKRRGIHFSEVASTEGGSQIVVSCEGGETEPGFNVRIWFGARVGQALHAIPFDETSWSGLRPIAFSTSLNTAGMNQPHVAQPLH